jgi:hypothetical protein
MNQIKFDIVEFNKLLKEKLNSLQWDYKTKSWEDIPKTSVPRTYSTPAICRGGCKVINNYAESDNTSDNTYVCYSCKLSGKQ